MFPFPKWSAMLLATLIVNGLSLPSDAQVAPLDSVPSAKDALSEPGLDDIPDQPTQLETWVCRNGTNLIAVEAKDMTNWQAIISQDQPWQCEQNIPTVPDNSPSFSCEPSEKMGLLTVFWLAGANGKTQMKTWMNDFANGNIGSVPVAKPMPSGNSTVDPQPSFCLNNPWC